MASVDTLYAEHRELEARAAALLRVVMAQAPDPAAVAALRWGMAQLLSRHCAHEDRIVYDPMIGGSDLAIADIAARCRAKHGELMSTFGIYIASWPVTRVAAEWERFRGETQTLVAALRYRMRDEEELVYTHAAAAMQRRAA